MFDFSKMMGSAKDGEDTFELEWSHDAVARIQKVPAGFMRNMTISRVETSAKAENSDSVSLEFLEKELADSTSMMRSMAGNSAGHPAGVKRPASTPDAPPAGDIYYCEICGFTMSERAEKNCPNCASTLEKIVKLKESEKETKVSKTSGQLLEWDAAALRELEDVPAGFMRDLTKWRVERLSRSNGLAVVTESVFREKYNQWQQKSQHYGVEMPWDKEALLKVEKIPPFIRGIVQKEVEKVARLKGATSVTSAMLHDIKERWNSGMKFHG